MGGSNETKCPGLRMHISGEEAHVHDDARDLKFSMDAKGFKNEVEEAFNMLKKDGIVEIQGDSKEAFCIMRSGRNFDAFIKSNVSIKTKLQSFIRNC